MRSGTALFLGLAVTIVWIQADSAHASESTLVITKPTIGQRVSPPLEVLVEFREPVDATTFRAKLNSVDVSQHFVVTASGASGQVSLADGIRVSGRGLNLLQIDARTPDGRELRAFTVFRATLPQFFLFDNPDDPVILAARKIEGDVYAFMGDKDDDGLATRVASARARSATGEETSVSYDSEGRPSRLRSADGWTFELRWETGTKLLVSALSPDGAAQANVSHDLTAPVAVTPANTGLAIDATPRMRNGIPPLACQQTAVMAAPQAIDLGPAAVTVRVEQCGSPVTDARVDVNWSSTLTGNAFRWEAFHVGGGVYQTSLPIAESPGKDVQGVCNAVILPVAEGCQVVGLLEPPAILQLCSAVAGAIALVNPPAAVPALGACVTTLGAVVAVCKVVGAGPDVPGAPGLADFVCKNVDEAVDFFFGPGEYRLSGAVTLPGQLTPYSSAERTAPSTGPFPELRVSIDQGQPKVASFVTEPADPAPLQSYVASADIQCGGPGSSVTVSISGTDGYTDSTSCPIAGSGTCSLGVPGAEAGVVDTVTVTIDGVTVRTTALVF